MEACSSTADDHGCRNLEGVVTPTTEATALCALIRIRRARIQAVLNRYGARNPRLFGSVAHGDATAMSDVDLLGS